MNTRRSIFEGVPDLTEKARAFNPKEGVAQGGPAAEKVAEVAEAVNFTSREPAMDMAGETKPSSVRRKPRYRKSGRTGQFTCRAKPEVLDELYQFVDDHGLMVGEVFEMAWEALKEKHKKN